MGERREKRLHKAMQIVRQDCEDMRQWHRDKAKALPVENDSVVPIYEYHEAQIDKIEQVLNYITNRINQM